MTPKEIDATILAFRERHRAATKDVSDLEKLLDYRILKGNADDWRKAVSASRTPHPCNRTASETALLVARMEELWQGILLVGKALDAADVERQAGGKLFGSEARMEEARRILIGDSIELAVAETPVLHRAALGGSKTTDCVSIARLFESMQESFSAAQKSLLSISGARDRVEQSLAALDTAILALQRGGWPGAVALKQVLLSAVAMSTQDPVGAGAVVDGEVAPAVETATAAFDQQRAVRESAAAKMAAARSDFAALETLDRVAAASLAEHTREIAGTAAFAAPDAAEAHDAGEWLDRLDGIRADGNYSAFQAGLSSWGKLLGKATADRMRLLDLTADEVSRRDWTRELYGALRAKHRARAAAGALEPSLDELAARLKAAVRATPTPLALAESLTSEYEARLARLTPNGKV